MERRPLGLSETKYAAKKDQALKHFDEQQSAIFEMVEGFHLLESNDESPIHSIRWRNRMNSEEVISAIFNGHLDMLPAPGYYLRPLGYERFNWKVFKERHGEVLGFFGIEMRLEPGFLFLQETVGESSFTAVQDNIQQLFQANSYPIAIRDTKGFRYINSAFESSRGTQVA